MSEGEGVKMNEDWRGSEVHRGYCISLNLREGDALGECIFFPGRQRKREWHVCLCIHVCPSLAYERHDHPLLVLGHAENVYSEQVQAMRTDLQKQSGRCLTCPRNHHTSSHPSSPPPPFAHVYTHIHHTSIHMLAFFDICFVAA